MKNFKILSCGLISAFIISGCALKEIPDGNVNYSIINEQKINVKDCSENKDSNVKIEYVLKKDMLPEVSFVNYKPIEDYKPIINICKDGKDFLNVDIVETYTMKHKEVKFGTNNTIKIEKCNSPKPLHLTVSDPLQVSKEDFEEIKNDKSLCFILEKGFDRNLNICENEDKTISVKGTLFLNMIK